MKNYVNGYSFPIFYIKNSNNVVTETIELALTGEDGLTEKFDLISIKHDLLNYTTSQKYLGHHVYFSLSYSEYSNLNNTLKIGKLIDYILNNQRIFLQPRADILGRVYEVIYTGDLQLGLNKGKIHAQGNKNIVLEFRTKSIQSRQLNIVNPNDLTIVLQDFVVVN